MSNIKLFESKHIRTVWNEVEEKWYFVVEDVIAVLTDSIDPKQYIKRMRQRDFELAKGWVQFVPTLSVDTLAANKKWAVQMLKGSYELFNLYHHLRLVKSFKALAHSKS
ncbi:MAG: hypothetical protein IPP29_07735 [Bacteroidetes bacterium]|nr:hypothetical protein [Bacteroidota bacterium]